MTKDQETEQENRLKLQTYFGFSKIPFTKYVWSSKMFQAKSQQELIKGLHFGLEVKGVSLVLGNPGVGKSITLRKFKDELSPQYYQPYYIWNTRSSPVGFLRTLCRTFQIPFCMYIADMFDSLSKHLGSFEETMGKYPVLIFDDCDNLSREILEYIRLLMNFQMDSEDKVSIIMCGTDKLQNLLRDPAHIAFRQRITYTHNLRAFTLDDTRAYVNYHLKRADAAPEIFSDGAVKLIFSISKGFPRVINQVAIQSLIHAAIHKKDSIDENLIRRNVNINLLLENPEEDTKQN